MEVQSEEKSRKTKRKEARLAKRKNRCLSWVENQKLRKSKGRNLDVKPNVEKKTKDVVDGNVWKREEEKGVVINDVIEEKPPKAKKSKAVLNTSKEVNKVRREKKTSLKRKKTKFEEYLETEVKHEGVVSAEEDLELERRLAKKLKIKRNKLGGADDELNMLFEGIPSILDEKIMGVEEDGATYKEKSSTKKRKKKDTEKASVKIREEELITDSNPGSSEPIENDAAAVVPEENHSVGNQAVDKSVKYVAPHLRLKAGKESEEHSQIRRQVRGLLNKLSESNVESVTEEISTIIRSISRSVGSQIISEEILASCSKGPRGTEQYAAVFAAFVAGIACLVGIDFSAKLISSLAKSFEDEYSKEDNLSLRNLTLLLSYLCLFGVCSSELIYDFIITLSKRLTEVDVSTILTILQCCGMKLRGDDPAAMKDFIRSIQSRVNELRTSFGSTSENRTVSTKRMEFMLETITDIKNNKRKSKEDPVQHTRIKKWLQKLKVEDILLRGLKWSKLLDPDKKGQWWLSGDIASTTPDDAAEVADKIDGEVLEAQKLLQLAAAQRMNTDSRRAIFCIIMSAEDYVDAFEKLLRLDLNGKQDREIMRVLVACCLQEKVFNKYYSVLASKLCSHDKNHKFTLQYCLWDHFKELDQMELIKSMNLARFTAEMLSSFSLSLGVLKTVELSEYRLFTPKRLLHFRMLFEAIFEHPDSTVWNIFTRIAVTPEFETLRDDILFFVKQYVVNTSKAAMAEKFKIAKKALNNAAGVLM
ncbi:hypothetical protein Scep_003555 [Stephania cephalantha]|uniref:MI domain-containing protein n=1 Tax=Stephania cephalantha TaxID=152367 RepID=A0AAP0KQR1_9MAGN